jgi:hypothetical protein
MGSAAEEIEVRILALVQERGPGRTIAPDDVARALSGSRPDQWAPLMQPIRRVAVRLMKEGRIVSWPRDGGGRDRRARSPALPPR